MSEIIEYRKAGIEDIDCLTQMRVSMLCDGTDYAGNFRERLRKNTRQYIVDGLCKKDFIAWVAAHNNGIIAMGGLALYTLPPNDWCPGGKTGYIGNMYTTPAFRKQGIAARLLALIVDEAKKSGCERILLNTTDVGRPMYEKYGFENSPTAMAYYPFK